MNIISKIFTVGAATAALALSSTAAFACTVPQGPQTQSWQGGDPCQGNLDSFSYGQHSYLDTSCKPVVPKPCKDQWGYTSETTWVWEHGHKVKCQKEVRTQDWNCTPKVPTPPPVRVCVPKEITFELPTYGSWLLDTGGPALTNGEVIDYNGQDWTVGEWMPGGHGSQGRGTYFTLTLNGRQLDGHGIKPEYATTVCDQWNPGGNQGGKGCTPENTIVSSTETSTPDVITYDSGSMVHNGEEVTAPAYGTTDYWVFGVSGSTFELSTTQNTDTVHVNGDVAYWTLTSVCPAVTPLTVH